MGFIQGGRQHQERMGGTGFAAGFVQVVQHFFGSGPQTFGNFAVFGLKKTGEDQFVHLLHTDTEFAHQPIDRFGDNLRVA